MTQNADSGRDICAQCGHPTDNHRWQEAFSGKLVCWDCLDDSTVCLVSLIGGDDTPPEGCDHPFDAIHWNKWNRATQCHRCGHVFDRTLMPSDDAMHYSGGEDAR